MVAFLGVQNLAQWLAKQGVERTLSGMTKYIEQDFARWETFDKTPRMASHTPFGVIELMPTSDMEEYAFKYVNGHPYNPGRGYQTVTAFGVLADVHNGYPTFVSEMTVLTALRTAATSAMVAKALARKDSERMAFIGAGSQSEFQALALRTALGIEKVCIYDTDPKASEKFVRNLTPLGFDITVAASSAEAVEDADVITTCIADKSHSVVLRSADVPAGAHINAVGGDCPGKTELDPEILELGQVFVEYPEQTRVEGEIQLQSADFPITELWQVLTGKTSGRTADDQITIFDSVGFAIADFAALRYARDKTKGSEFLDDIDLIADPKDPKDLFGLVPSLSPVE